MKVCIAEKPSVAREIAQIVGANSRRNGYFEGNGYQVTWTFGHLCTLKEPHDYYENWKWWNLNTLPMIPSKFGIKLIDDEGIQRQFEVIKSLVDEADEVINCGDAGQEGEVIQRWVLHKAEYNKSLKRLWISSLTEEAIREGFENLKEGSNYDKLYAAGSARAIGDWLLGMNATRLYSLKYGNGKGVLSIGRVQTPTLALVVQRQLEIDNFEPQPYWELKTVYRDVTFNVKTGRFDNKEDAEIQLAAIKDYPFFITDITTKKGTEIPPKLFDLTSLQVECNRKFSYSAEQTLKIIQSLYEKKLTTYPRVDTTFLSNDIYKKVPQILKGLKPYVDKVEPILKAKIKKSKKVFDDSKITDHHAIIPTGQFSISMSPEEKRVFDLVARRFIAVFYPDCKVANTTVLGEVNKIDFKATGKQILEPGWRVLFSKEKSLGDDDNVLPEFVKGESGPHAPDLAEKMTQPPKYYSEATLLRAMETAGKLVDDDELRDLMKENGIGRPSTRANIIETLFRRKYIARDKKRIVATQTGIELINSIENDLLKSAELTGLWEKKMRDIEKGTFDISQFMQEMREMVAEVVYQVKRSPKKQITIIEEEEKKKKSAKKKEAKAPKDLKCPKCIEGELIKGKSAWGCQRFKEGCKFVVPFVFMDKKLTQKQFETLVEKRKTGVIKGFKLDNEDQVSGNLILNDEFKLELSVKE